MNPDQAWQSVLGQLQMEMPKASFETWVRDTKVISLDDGVIKVGVRNAYARDWLESRLESTVNRLLVGVLNMGVVRVNFVVSGENTEDRDNEIDEDKSDDVVEVSLTDYDSAYEQVVHPNRAAYLPGYFRRWLRILGPDLGWLYVAFRQASYTAGSRTGKVTNRISGGRIASLAGCVERTFWRRVERSDTWEKLKGLVRIADHGPEWDRTSSTPKRLSRRYTVSMTMPLTPIDTNSLSRWFSANIEKYGGPEAVLRAAAEVPLDELIPLDVTETSDPVTVTMLVRDLFGGGDLSRELLDGLASAIQNHIMPQGDLIVVTEYFLRNILPHIGAGQGWMLTLLRDMCYVNTGNGESRNRVTVKGGYAEIAGWLGMSRPRTIWDWLNEKHPPSHDEAGKYKNPVSRVYMCEIEKSETALDFEGQPRTFDVLLDEIPREFLEIALTNPNDAIVSIALTRLSEANDATVSIGMTRLSTSDDAIVSIALTRLSESVAASVRVLSSLTLKTNSLNTRNTTTLNTNTEKKENDDEAVEEQGAVNAPSVWVLDRILIQNRVHPKTQKTIRGASAKALISWLLYTLSPDGQGIDKPMSYALARLKDDPQNGAGDGYDDLANLPPVDLLDVTHKASRGHLVAAFQRDDLGEIAILWLDVMGSNDSSARKLLRLLLGSNSPSIVTRVRRSERWEDTNDGETHIIEESIVEI